MHILSFTTMVVALLLAALFLHFYRVDREECFKWWLMGWFVYALRFPLDAAMLNGMSAGFVLASMLVSLVCSWLFLRGTLAFVGHGSERGWGVFSVVAIVLTAVGIAEKVSFHFVCAPISLMSGLMLLSAGLSLRADRTSSGPLRWVAVVGLGFWGLQTMSYPWLRPVAAFHTIGFELNLLGMLVVAGSVMALFVGRGSWLMSTSNRLTLALAETHELQDGLRLCLDAALAITRTTLGGVYLFNEEGALELVVSEGMDDTMRETVQHYGSDSRNVELVKLGKPVYAPMERVEGLVESQMRRSMQGFATIPISGQGRILGCLNVASEWHDDVSMTGRRALENIVAKMGNSLARLKAEDSLRMAERRMRTIVDSRYQSSAILDSSGKMLTVNRVASDAAGCAEGALLGRFWWDGPWWQHDPVQRDRVRALFENALTGRRASKDVSCRDVRLGIRLTSVTASPVMNEAGDVVNVLTEGYDQTAERQMQTQMRHAEKMKSVAILASGVAHDFNNIIGGIVGYAQMSMDDVAPDSVVARNLGQILKAGARVRGLVQQLLMFSRPGDHERHLVLLAQVVQDAAALTAASFPDTIRVNVHVEEPGTMVCADDTGLQATIINLVRNAAQAMNSSGRVDVTVRREVRPEATEGKLGTSAPGRYAVVEVQDEGCGMPPEVIDRMFEPFFTTKAPDKGTGLGLPVVYGIVQSHGGNIEVSSEVGKGTMVRVLIPEVDGDVASNV